MKAAELFVRCLEAEGVSRIFAVPGEENLDLLDALHDSIIEVVVCRHEQSACFMAAAQGRLTGDAGVVLATLGPGATNLVTAAAHANLGAMPVVMITGQKPIREGKQGAFQLVDVVDMFQPLTKYTQSLVSARFIPSRVREAFRLAQQERPGATHLELPEDIARENVDLQPIAPAFTRRPTAEKKSVNRAVERIQQAKRPLLLIGAGANRKLTRKMLTGFVEQTGIPFITTQMGKGVVDETRDEFIGCAALSEGDFVHRAIDHADLMINVGHDVVEKPPFVMEPDGVEVIHVDFSPARTDPVYFPQVEVVGDIANSIWQISRQLDVQDDWDFEFFGVVRQAMIEHVGRHRRDAGFPIRPERLVQDVGEAMGEDGLLSLDNGLYKLWFARNLPVRHPNTMLLDNALATMGAGLPTAIGARLVHRNRPILAVCGDGGFMMNSQELETAVRLELDLVVLVLRDDAYGMIRWKQEQMELADYGLGFGNPDFVAYAESYGAQGHRVDSADDLQVLLKQSLEAGGVHLIEVPIDYSDSDEILHRRIREEAEQLKPASTPA